ncbi:MAG: hypothetical protein GY707_10995 [Desulfobacteraceae bacterium]|nr:hypothetical protein [Desulfobacteraceae bacterium]
MIARSINIERIEKLKGNNSDLKSQNYLRIKDQLLQIRKAHSTCRFLYLMGRNNKKEVFFFLDSQPTNSKDYAPPGLIYEEVSDEYLNAFNTGKEYTVGPIKDRWGASVTSLVPIYSKEKNKLIAILGMDIDAKDWNRKILVQCLIPISLIISILLLLLILFIINRDKLIVEKQYIEMNETATQLQMSLEHVSKLQGLLPICASCKKIKDDHGYWNQLDSYIEEHSEIKFSHGLCGECSEKLYGNDAWYKKMKEKKVKAGS